MTTKDLNVALICFQNEDKTLERWERDILPALGRDWRGAVYCVDNSPQVSLKLNALASKDHRFHYLWTEGSNWQYSKSLNYIVGLINSEFFLYVCTEHGFSMDDSWIEDIIQPLRNSSETAIAGCVNKNPDFSNCGEIFSKFPESLPAQHVQGGVFAGRTHVFKKHPYPANEIPQDYSDIYISAELMFNGYKLAHVDSIKSVWRQTLPLHDLVDYKFIHDCRNRFLADTIRPLKPTLSSFRKLPLRLLKLFLRFVNKLT